MNPHLPAMLVGLIAGGLTFAKLYQKQRDNDCPA